MSIRKWTNRLYAKKHITIRDENLDYYVDKLNNNVPFSFSRFGDGEWNAILGKPGHNCDGHEYFPEMGKQLRNAVINNLSYIYSIQNMAIRNEGRKISLFLKKNNVNLEWHNSDVFHYANIDGRFFPMIETLRQKKLVIIGPPHLRDLKNCFNYDSFIEIPPQNCYLKLNDIKDEIITYGRNKKKVVYSFSASMPANILIHELFPIFGNDNWLIDFGSVWDVYVGVKSRGHYNSEKWQDILKKNLGQSSE